MVSLTPSVILTYLAFVQTRNAMRHEIQVNLESQAATVSADIDHMLFERLQNALSWSRLDVMQDLRIADVDKRLSQFLLEVKEAYGGLYEDLYCVDVSGRIIASSRPELIGMQSPSFTPWLTATLPNGTVILGPLSTGPEKSRRPVAIRSTILSGTGEGRLGELVLLFDWSQIEDILDAAAHNGRSVAVLDDAGRAIADSSDLRADPSLSRRLPAIRALIPPQSKVGTAVQADAAATSMMVGYSRSQGFERFAGFAWTTLVFQPSVAALGPVRRMQLTFLVLLTSTLLLTGAFAIFIAARIAFPITQLTALTRRFARERKLPESLPVRRGEVGELADAFINMVRDLDRSRQGFLRASRLAVAGEFAATIAHEIRTPLGILRSSAQVLRQETGLSPEGRELVGYVESETERINRLVAGLLESANPRPPIFALHDVSNIVHACIVMLMPQAEQKQIRIEQNESAGNLIIDCDVEQLIQVILNLMLNALQLLPLNGRVSIDCIDEGPSVRIDIGDDGPGIPESDRAHVFEPFFSKRRGGLGLGLSVALQIVSAHHGTIQIGESRWGGALFSIFLPRSASE